MVVIRVHTQALHLCHAASTRQPLAPLQGSGYFRLQPGVFNALLTGGDGHPRCLAWPDYSWRVSFVAYHVGDEQVVFRLLAGPLFRQIDDRALHKVRHVPPLRTTNTKHEIRNRSEIRRSETERERGRGSWPDTSPRPSQVQGRATLACLPVDHLREGSWNRFLLPCRGSCLEIVSKWQSRLGGARGVKIG